jgi:hypothetical protein
MRSLAPLLGAALLLTAAAAPAQTPPAAPVPAPAPAHRNPGVMVAGIVLTSLASGMLAATASMIACCHKTDENGQSLANTWGVILGLSSGLTAAVGIPLWVSGARAPAPPPPSAVPLVGAGPRGVVLRWAF